MKIARYRVDGRVAYGAVEDDNTIRELETSPLESLRLSDTVRQLDAVKILAPVDSPRVFGVGLNYAAHAKEANQAPPPSQCCS